ncbi:hypothetical protein [Anatilimnocola floriformis]|uniref:hypothetical protein n=1 Tax=Anatilimnocola floriformis TaxID=2948575 RepID=UPI0020C5A016|nr:hypothetical protein [Anatilimnocola floriformis]
MFKRFDPSQLQLSELLSEIPVARVVFLDAAERQYLLLSQVSPFGFFSRLPVHITEAKKDGESQLTCENQLYNLQLKSVRGRCQLQDLYAKNSQPIELEWKVLSAGVRDASVDVFQLMKLAFPWLTHHRDVEQLRHSLGIEKQRY